MKRDRLVLRALVATSFFACAGRLAVDAEPQARPSQKVVVPTTMSTSTSVPTPATSPAPLPSTPDVEALPPATPAMACAPDERNLGTACCSHSNSNERARAPGQQIMRCRGPRIGLPCKRASDCDVACECPSAPKAPPWKRDRSDLPAGTTGLTGTCASGTYVGVWMCRLDDKGQVTHMIID